MLATVEAITGKVFGEIKVLCNCNQSLESFYEETVLPQKEITFMDEYENEITVQCHDIFVDKENNTNSDRASVITFIISTDVDTKTEEDAFMAANYRLNNFIINSNFQTFSLEDYHHTNYSFNVIDFDINWNEFVHNF